MESIDIIIPVYNNSILVLEAINSALNQNNVNVNVIVVNDGSTDDTEEKIKSWENFTKINYYTKQNGGVASARNVGLSYLKSNYICFLDCDDILYPNFCELLIEEMKKNDHYIAFSDYNFISEKDSTQILAIKKHEIYWGKVKTKILQGNFFMTPTVLFSSKIYNKEKFDEELNYNEDWKFWINYLIRNKIAYIDNKLVGIRSLGSGLSAKKELHGKSYYTVVKYIHKKLPELELNKKEINEIYYIHAFNLLSYDMSKESFQVFKLINIFEYTIIHHLMYLIKYSLVKLNLISFYRKVRRLFIKERLDII